MQAPFAESFLLNDVGRQYQSIVKWALFEEVELEKRIAQLRQQVKAFFMDLTEDGGQNFSNHFARMHYVSQAAQLNPKLTYYLHQFEREGSLYLAGKETRLSPKQILLLGAKALLDVIEGVIKLHIPAELSEYLPKAYDAFQLQSYTVAEFRQHIRVIVLEDLEAKQQLRVRLKDDPSLDHYVHYGREGFNEQFVKPAVQMLGKHFELPLEVNLLAVEVDTEGELVPGHLIIDPDFLVDITAVSKCFDATGPEPMKYLLGRVTPYRSSVAMIAGNVANHFLDMALTGRGRSFRESFGEVFTQYPLQLAKLSDDEVRDLMTRCQGHYKVIQSCLDTHFTAEAIDREQVVVEPSFYAERYGLQGRLDVFQPPAANREAAIVELKSGKIFRPNEHKVNQEHYIQTLLYDLLIKSVFEDKVRPRNYILYSSEKETPLRYAPATKTQQFEALSVRNKMMTIERLLALSTPTELCPLDWLTPERYPTANGFVKTQLEQFYAAYSNLTSLEKKYFRAFTGFIAREQRLAKVGTQDGDRLRGQAILWQESLENKLEGYAILHDLKVMSTATKDDFPVIGFQRPPAPTETISLTSFRRGDIIVLYAGDSRKHAILHGQVYKGTITQLTDDRVDVRLRASQPDLTTFQQLPTWNIEPDLFDSSFTRLYRNLAEFAAEPVAARRLVLGLRAPEKPGTKNILIPAALTKEQGVIFNQILNARDYYVLWGPPGTGKTSMMLHHLCDHLVNKTKERTLVLAFTNRAVDEICKAISNIGGDIDNEYIRIGSSFGCDPAFSRQLLQNRIKSLSRREEIISLLQKQRIVTGTFSSVLGKGESLFDLVKFDRLIIDEASQLLEPAMINLVAKFPRTVLIGDHRQLPAVVTQPEEQTKIDDEELRSIGLVDLRNSLFERLYLKCQLENWDWAFGQLTRQGRMHTSLADYANTAFYDRSLRGLELTEASRDWQQLPNAYPLLNDSPSLLEQKICECSFVFVDTEVDLTDKAFRTNGHEADAIVETLQALLRIKDHAHETLDPKQVGIITPYRAQIARIRLAIRDSTLDSEWNSVNIDTVERYQGSSYKIILLSLCANQGRSIARLSSLNHESRDRKLNVALTRAKERVIAFGNIELLRLHNAAYADFIAYCVAHDGVVESIINR